MIVIIALTAAILSILIWNLLSASNSYLNFEIEESHNLSYDVENIKEISPLDLINEIEKSEINNNPMLIHFYTSWCRVCKKQLPIINEIARKFQNTDLNILFVAIDKDITRQRAINSLSGAKELYFQPQYLGDRGGFKGLLKNKSINFKNRIPFSALIGRDSQVIAQFSGYKNFKYFDKRIMKSLFVKDED